MAVRKTAIAIPEELLEEVDRVAALRGESRSRYITGVLKRVVRARRDAEITRRLNELFAQPAVQVAHKRALPEDDELEAAWREEGW